MNNFGLDEKSPRRSKEEIEQLKNRDFWPDIDEQWKIFENLRPWQQETTNIALEGDFSVAQKVQELIPFKEVSEELIKKAGQSRLNTIKSRLAVSKRKIAESIGTFGIYEYFGVGENEKLQARQKPSELGKKQVQIIAVFSSGDCDNRDQKNHFSIGDDWVDLPRGAKDSRPDSGHNGTYFDDRIFFKTHYANIELRKAEGQPCPVSQADKIAVQQQKNDDSKRQVEEFLASASVGNDDDTAVEKKILDFKQAIVETEKKLELFSPKNYASHFAKFRQVSEETAEAEAEKVRNALADELATLKEKLAALENQAEVGNG